MELSKGVWVWVGLTSVCVWVVCGDFLGGELWDFGVFSAVGRNEWMKEKMNR